MRWGSTAQARAPSKVWARSHHAGSRANRFKQGAGKVAHGRASVGGSETGVPPSCRVTARSGAIVGKRTSYLPCSSSPSRSRAVRAPPGSADHSAWTAPLPANHIGVGRFGTTTTASPPPRVGTEIVLFPRYPPRPVVVPAAAAAAAAADAGGFLEAKAVLPRGINGTVAGRGPGSPRARPASFTGDRPRARRDDDPLAAGAVEVRGIRRAGFVPAGACGSAVEGRFARREELAPGSSLPTLPRLPPTVELTRPRARGGMVCSFRARASSSFAVR